MECHVYWLMKSSCFKLSGEEKYGLFWAKKLYLLIIGKFLFWTFPRWEIRVFLAKKLMERRYLLITEKALFWTFWRWKNGIFFWAKKLMERWYLLGLFEFSMIFKGLGNMVFHAVTTNISSAFKKWFYSTKI